MEVLEHSVRPMRRRPGWLIIAAAAIVGLVILGAFRLDGWQRERESLDLQRAFAGAVAVIEGAEADVRGTVAYASPLLQVGPVAVRTSLEDLVLEEVAEGLTEYEQARAALAGAPVWPWHTDQVAQREELLADLAERARSLTEATGQGLAAP